MENRLGSGARGLDSGSYTDLNRLSQLKVGKDRDGEENVRKVAQEFESLFLNEMLKSMRAATEVLAKDNPLNSQASKQYQDMYDQQLSVSLSKEGGGIGLADVLVRQLSKQTETVTRNNPFAQVAQTEGAAWPSKPAAGVESARDDSRLLNQRRLALPGKLSERQVASVSATAVPPAGDAVQPLVNVDWKPATAFVPPADKPLTVNGVEKSAPNAPSKTRFSSSQEFIATMLPMAEKAAERLGIEPRFLVAQAALETGWGKSMIRQKDGSNSHNLFGIKAGKRWEGATVEAKTTEYVEGTAQKENAKFRSYDSYADAFRDYAALLRNNPRYGAVIGSQDGTEFARRLQQAGYATDPQYANKLASIINGPTLRQALIG